MAICPVCKHETDTQVAACPACGYRFHDSTQEFEMIPVEGLTAENKTTASAVPILTIKYGRQEGLVYRLDADSATIGRSPKCAVFLNDMTVSRDHALIEKVDGVWTIRDAASFNGVWVNNKNIDHAVLRDGDIIQIGCFILKFSE